MRTPALALAATAPGVVVGTLLWLVVIALAPPGANLGLLVVGLLLITLVAVGPLETVAVQLLTCSRRTQRDEAALLEGLEKRLELLGLGRRHYLVRCAPRPATPAAVAIGRSSVVVRPSLVRALREGAISADEATVLIAHVTVSSRVARPGGAPASRVLALPARLVVAAFRAAAGLLQALPLLGLAWQARGLLGVVCIVHALVEDTPGGLGMAVVAAAIIALSYITPAAGRAQQRMGERAADDLLAARGLGPAYARLLRRTGSDLTPARARQLEQRDAPADRGAAEIG